MCSRLAALIVFSCAFATGAYARQDPPPAQPTFNTGVSLELVDLAVTNGNEPIPDLTRDELILLVDDVRRPIVSLVYAPAIGPASKPPVDTREIARTVTITRRVVFVVDRESLNSNDVAQLQRTAEDFVGRLPAHVQIAVAALPLGASLRFDATRRATVEALRATFKGANRVGAELQAVAGYGCTDEAAEAGCGDQGMYPRLRAPEMRAANTRADSLLRGRRALADLQSLFTTLSGGPPSDVVILSGRLPFQSGLSPEKDRTFAAAQTAGVRVHAIEMADLGHVTLPEGRDETQHGPKIESLREAGPTVQTLREEHASAYGLPEETGGVHAEGTVSGADFFRDLSRQLSCSYLLSFAPIETDRDGKPHRIEVRVPGRPQLMVRVRKAFIAPAGSSNASLGGPSIPDAPANTPPAPAASFDTSATKVVTSASGKAASSDAQAWIALVQSHELGTRDRALLDVAQWDGVHLKKAVTGLRSMRRTLPPDALNKVLLRGALLHTDVALLAPDLALLFDGFPDWTAVQTVDVADGRALGSSVVSAHWRLARVLLDQVSPRSNDDPQVLAWYRAVGATLLVSRRYAVALPHLREAQRLFPHDRDVNMLSGLVHEALAGAVSRDWLGTDRAAVDAQATELQAARQDFTRATAAAPSSDIPRLHLGRVCHLLGDDKAAVGSLTTVLSMTKDSSTRYVAELVLGSIHEAAGRFAEAHDSYERANSLQPLAQSALVALSHLADKTGSRTESAAYINRLAALPHSADARSDPWWRYETATGIDEASLLDGLRSAANASRTR